MGDKVEIDKQAFHDRLASFIGAWKKDQRSGDTLFGGANSIVILMGRPDDAAFTSYRKNNAMHLWLLGYEFPATLILLTAEKVYIVTTTKKAKHLEPLVGGKTPVELLVKGKDAEQNTKNWTTCIDVIKAAGKKVGTIAKDASTGPFVDEWNEAFKEPLKELTEVDISQGLSAAALSVQDESELRIVRTASKACTSLMAEFFVEEMSEVLDEEKKVSHKQLSDRIDKKVDDKSFFTNAKAKLPGDFDTEQLEWVYGPVVQSGGKYDLKLSAQSDDTNLHAGTIIAGMGLRYKNYCSMVARTYLVDPNKSQESNYKFLLTLHESIISSAKDGMDLKEVYNKALGMIRAKKPDMEKHFLKNVGAGIGIETRDATLIINGKNTRKLSDGMTLCIMTGFSDITNPEPQDKRSNTYSLLLMDTIRIKDSPGAVVFTNSAPSDLESTSFFFKDDEEEQESPKAKTKKDSKVGAVATSNITKTKLRADRAKQNDEGAEQKRREHQKELAAKKQEEGKKRYSEATGDQNGVTTKKFKRFESYKRDNQFPSRVERLEIVVDQKASTVVVPIMGRPVPFHIHTIKNASHSEEGDYTFLRINFLSPGQGVGRKDDQPFEDPSAHFVRSLTFRSKDSHRMEDISNQITELRKNIVRKEQEKKEMEDVVEQDKLIEIRNRKPVRLDNVFVRPGLDGKRIPGEVDIHQNGLRYKDHRGNNIDVLFSNVRHLFFQPCTHELIVIIHVHLRNPIMIGKKKAKDVQFYREATDMQFDETGNRKRKHRLHDEEEFEQEQEERRRRAALDREFKGFAEKIQNAANEDGITVDIPFRELGFNGVPFRSNVFMQPTTDCLVQLTEPPFTCITLEEIEIAHLERVQFGLKNFDMVFVFKDFHRAPVHVNTIPVESLEGVKDWLNSVDIPYYEGPLNLNWGSIMKTVTGDTHAFFEDGGWGFLNNESDDEGGEEESEESAFEMSDGSVAALDEESSDEESDFDDDASADASEEDGSFDESGEDWDELEKKAARKDRESGLVDEEVGKKRKR